MRGYAKAERSVTYRPEVDPFEFFEDGCNRVIYDGPSVLDPRVGIVVIAGWQSMNRKIGPMVQLWILTRDWSPIDAVKTGTDAAICGNCPHRGPGGGVGRSCYVEWWRAPNNIHQALASAKRETPKWFALRVRLRKHRLRIGAYGDPAAVPLKVWTPLIEAADGWTAYTHQWRDARFAALRSWCMASVDSEEEQAEASRAGWRTFRVRPSTSAPVLTSEIVCPASDEGGNRVVCAECELCKGAARPAKSIVIAAHGSYAAAFRRRHEVDRPAMDLQTVRQAAPPDGVPVLRESGTVDR